MARLINLHFSNPGSQSSGLCGVGSCSTRLPLIIGFSVGIPLVLLICCFVMCVRRRAKMLRSNAQCSNAGRIGCIPALLVVPILLDDGVQNEHERQADDQPPNDPPPSYEE